MMCVCVNKVTNRCKICSESHPRFIPDAKRIVCLVTFGLLGMNQRFLYSDSPLDECVGKHKDLKT